MIPHPRPRLLGRRLLRQPSGRSRSGLRLLRKRGLLQNLRSRNRKNSRHLKRRKRRNREKRRKKKREKRPGRGGGRRGTRVRGGWDPGRDKRGDPPPPPPLCG